MLIPRICPHCPGGCDCDLWLPALRQAASGASAVRLVGGMAADSGHRLLILGALVSGLV